MNNHLFVIDPDTQLIQLNKEWIHLVPELALLLRRDKGSPGDYRGDKKLKATREITYIYFMESFNSPIIEWDSAEKHVEALRCAGLEDTDMDKDLRIAQHWYHDYLRKSSRSLRTLDALWLGMDELDRYFKEVDFDKTDKLGRSKYTAKEYIGNVKDLKAMNASIKEYEKQVEQELRENTGIRGKNSLGLTEGQRKQGWDEGNAPTGDRYSLPRETTEI